MRSRSRFLPLSLLLMLLLSHGLWAQRTQNGSVSFNSTTADISVSPGSLNFAVPINGSDNSSLRIKNSGTTPLTWNIQENEPVLILKDGTRLPLLPYSLNIGEIQPVKGVSENIGGPDNFGYIFIDSNEPGGPVFSWTDISGTGTQLTVGDEGFALINVFFDFTFYGQIRNQIQVSANGFLTFGSPVQQNINPVIPNSAQPNDIIAPFWDDLIPGLDGGTVHVLEDFTNRQLIIQYTNVRRAADPNTRLSFQVIIRENQEILFQYLTMTGVTNSATIGIENATGTDGLQIINNQPYVTNNLAVLISPGCSWLTATPISGLIPAGDSIDVAINVDATGLAVGNYSCELIVNSDALNAPQISVPVLLTVGPPIISVSPELLDFGTLLLGNSDTLSVTVSNIGNQDLEVSNLAISGLSFSDYRLVDNSPFVLPGNDSRVLDIIFEPLGTGPKIADLIISSNDANNPQKTISLTGVSVAPDINVTPLSHNFGDILIGTNSTKEFIISNTGTADLIVEDNQIIGTAVAEFAILRGAPFVIPRFGSDTITVQFTPQTPGNKTATLRITNSDPDENPVDVSLTATSITPEIDVTPLVINYDEVIIGTFNTQNVTVSNIGNAPLTLSAMEISGADSADFSILNGGSQVLPPQSSVALQIRFMPQLPGNKTATLRISSDDLDEPTTDVALTGTARGIPDIRVVPLTVNFGEVPLTEAVEGAFLVLNEGSDTLVANSQLIGNTVDFSVVGGGGNFNVAMGDTHTIVVRFSPVQLGQLFTILRVNSNDPDENPTDVTIFGTGVVANILVSPLSVSFGDVAIDTAAFSNVSVSNTGTTPLTVTNTDLSGADFASFSLPNLVAPFVVNPNETIQLTVRFAPRITGAKSASLTIKSTAFNSDSVTVSLSGNGVGEPDIAAEPTQLDFGNVDLGQSSVLNSVISNVGLVDLNISSVVVSGANFTEFSIISSVSQVLAPGESDTLKIAFTPGSAGSKTASIVIASNDSDENPLNIPLSGNAVTPGIVVNPQSLEFGNRFVNQQLTRTVTVLNSGSSNLNVSTSEISGTDPGSFAIRDGGAPFSLAPGDSQIISVTFLPVTAGEKSASLNLTTNVPGMENVSIALSGKGVAPDISVAPDSLDFGSIFVNTTSIKNVLITNTGDTTLSIVNIRITGLNYGSFDTPNITAAFDIEPGETDTIMVRFKPAVAIEHLANLEITSNDPDEEIVNVPLRGIALPTPIPNIVVSSDSLGFGTVVLGNSTSLSLIISNDGTAPLEVSALDLSGSTPEAFATNATPPITINPGDSQSVEIVFTPQSEGQKAALLSILNNDPDMPEVQVILTGTGVATPTIRISSNLLNFADVAPSDSADQSVTVYNDGTATLDIVNIEVTTDSAGAEFKLLSAPSGTILPGDSLILDVRFTGISAGIKTGSLNIFSNDPQMGSTTVALTGRVIVPDIAAIPPSIAIVDVPINTTVSAILKIVNDATATAELNVSASTVVGDTMEFKITSGAAPFTLQPGDTQMVTVAYTAITTDTSYAQLHFTSNDPDENPFVVPLKGNGIIPFAHDFIFLANDRMSYESALRVEGNSFSNNVINIHDGISGVQNGNLTAVNDVELRHNNTLNGNITYGKEVLVEGTLNGSIFKDNDLQPIELPILSFSAGGANITVSEFDTLNLEPGSYENADIFGLLVLKPGKYYFKRIDFQKDSRLLVDATDGLVEMNVVDFTLFRRGFNMDILPDGEASSSRFMLNSMQTADLEISRNTRFLGSIVAPNSQVKLEREVIFKGIICAERVKVKQFVFAVHHFSTTPLPADSVALARQLASHLESIVPEVFALEQNYPNPFNPNTTIEFGIAEKATDVSIKIYDITGRLVHTLVDERMIPGRYTITWDGLTQNGVRAASGIYIYRMIAGQFVESRKMLLLK